MRMITLLAVILFSSFSYAKEMNPNYIYSSNITSRFNITEVSPWKEFYLPSMRYIMMRFELNGSENKFCAIGYNLQDKQKRKYREAIVFWDKGEEIITWRAEDFDINDGTKTAVTIAESPFISYGAVLPRDSITMGMMNYYAKEDVDPMRADCERNGEIITVKAFPTPRECKINIVSYDCVEKLLEL